MSENPSTKIGHGMSWNVQVICYIFLFRDTCISNIHHKAKNSFRQIQIIKLKAASKSTTAPPKLKDCFVACHDA